MKQFKLLLAILTILVCSSKSFAGIDPNLATKLQTALDSARKSLKLEGTSAAININGTTWEGASGNSYSSHPMTTDMELCIGSDTKLFMSTILLKLQEKGILSLDDTIGKWLPPMKNVDMQITIRQMLNHTSGIADYLGSLTGLADSVMKDQSRTWSPQKLAGQIGTPYFAKGTNWVYSNSDYLLAGMIIKAATHDTLTHQLHSIILNSLQLSNTYLDSEDTLKGEVAHPWENGYDIKNYLYNPRTAMSCFSWAAGGMYSTARNMSDWYQAIFTGKVLSDTSMKELLTFVNCNPTYGMGYGLGISKDTSNGRNILKHGGAIFGYLSRNLYDSIGKISIFALVNQDGIEPQPIVTALHKVLIEYQATGIKENSEEVSDYSIYPNPFSNSLTTHYTLATPDNITMKITDITGKVIDIIPVGMQTTGTHDFTWNVPVNAHSGVYIYSVSGKNGVSSKMVVKN